MKKLLAILALLAVLAGLFLLLRTKNPPVTQPTAPIENLSVTVSNKAPARSNTPDVTSIPPNGSPQISGAQTSLAVRAASPNGDVVPGTVTNEVPALPPATVLDKTRVLIHNYHAALGENPVGTNPEIAAALQGKNSKQINFLADSGLRLNGKGELIDGYGTPFFFHQLSAHEMEIRSAGPDKVMWTADDLITR